MCEPTHNAESARVSSLLGCCDGPRGDGEKRTWRNQLAKLFVLPRGGKPGSMRCETTHNAEAACEAVRVSSRIGYTWSNLGAK